MSEATTPGPIPAGKHGFGKPLPSKIGFYRLKLVLETDICGMILDKHNCMSYICIFSMTLPSPSLFWIESDLIPQRR